MAQATAQLTARDIHGPFTQLLTNLQGENGPEWLEALKRFNRKENPWDSQVRKHPPGDDVYLGQHPPDQYRGLLQAEGIKIRGKANEMLSKMPCLQEETHLDLLTSSVSSLGLQGGANYAEICDKAAELGLELCPAEVGPALRLRYEGKNNKSVLIAMDPIQIDRFIGNIFALGRTEGIIWIDSQPACPTSYFSGLQRFVFVRK